jgi:hypothetical protein
LVEVALRACHGFRQGTPRAHVRMASERDMAEED